MLILQTLVPSLCSLKTSQLLTSTGYCLAVVMVLGGTEGEAWVAGVEGCGVGMEVVY